MKKLIFILLMCFAVAFAAFAIDMSPHPGDSLETVLTVQDYVVISQVENVPAIDVLHIEQFNFNNEICMVDYDITGTPFQLSTLTVSYIGYEMASILYKTGEDVAIYKTEFG